MQFAEECKSVTKGLQIPIAMRVAQRFRVAGGA
jgi:hypothetical protein